MSNPTIIGIVLASLGSLSGIAALITAVSRRRTVESEALQTLSGVWNTNLDQLSHRMDALEQDNRALRSRVSILERELAAAEERNRVLVAVLTENRIDLPTMD